jgi:hypothetical protein
MLVGCRCQRSHAKNVEATESGSVSGSGSDILFDEWVKPGKSAHALSGQLLLDVSTNEYVATLRIVFPDTREVVWTNLSGATRKILEFEGSEYIVDVTEVSPYYGVRISIIQKR